MFENLDFSDDIDIWQFAKDNNFVIVTKDIDFNELSVLNGFPPKVIWLNIGNCNNDRIEKIIQSHSRNLILFAKESESGFIEIN
ncbi:MAG: DUF5615 family PIN-like protein [Proteobacteria bacterium]|nr:DUF5615 family PIN-like protein [Pseudomonadota bacterium]